MATVTVRLADSGGAANGSVDISSPQTFTITVTKPHPWHNASVKPLDVTADGFVVAGDALAIINYIYAFGSSAVPADATVGRPSGFLDTTGGVNDSGDNFVAPNDALAIINYINALRTGGGGESFSAGVSDAVPGMNNPQLSTTHDDWTDLLALLALDTAQQHASRTIPLM